MSNAPDLPATLDEVWHLLKRGVASADAPARFPVLATVDAEGAPQARTVVLRAADRSRGELEIHTDILSHKIKELHVQPRAALQVWHPVELVQLRLAGTVSVETGEAVADRWDQVPPDSRVAYGHLPAPGTPIGASDAYVCAPSRDRFALLRVTLTRIEAVSLDPAGHRRAIFLRDDGWRGQWLSP